MARQTLPDPATNPDLYAYGDNADGSREVFVERQRYNNSIFTSEVAPNFVESWGAFRFYGIINNLGNPVTVDTTRLRALRYTNGVTHYALDFVADAWADFVTRINEMVQDNELYTNSPWATIAVGKGWISPEVEYENYMFDVVYPAFNETYLGIPGNTQKVQNIETFIAVFDDFIQDVLDQGGPLTFSGFIESSYLSLLSSGLMIEVDTDATYDDDFAKSYSYKDSNFSLVARIANQYGFAVDKNIPWRFIADLRNPAMQEYMHGIEPEGFIVDNSPVITCEPYFGPPELAPRAFGYSQVPGMEDVKRHVNVYFSDDGTPETGYLTYQEVKNASQEKIYQILFSTSYRESWTRDAPLLVTYLVSLYNALVNYEPILTVPRTGPNPSGCSGATIIVERSAIDEDAFGKLYDNRWVLKTLYLSRTRERNTLKNPVGRAQDIQRIMNIYNLTPVDSFENALRYFQEQFVGPADVDPLTLGRVGDIIGKETSRDSSTDENISDAGRQERMRRYLR
jgi:hypothetical protein